jgi:hypothetical protein
MISYLQNKIIWDGHEEIKIISETIGKYYLFFRDVSSAPIGKYSINIILETVEESLNYLEIFGPVLKKWIVEYLEKNRGTLWLFYGISKGAYLTDYWKISETRLGELKLTWPFLYNRTDPHYKGFVVDLGAAQNEVLRQRKRQDTSNPNYTPFHPDGCPSSGCSCFMLDDMEQWYNEEQAEIKASKNIFFNGKLQNDFYKAACEDLGELKAEWEKWTPENETTWKKPDTNLKNADGLTPIKIILSWIQSDFNYCWIFTMFHWSDVFKNVWENVDHIDDFIKIERDKLKKIVDLL